MSVRCVADTPLMRVLDGELLTLPRATHDKCVAECTTRAFRYAGLQRKTLCYCGDYDDGLNGAKPAALAQSSCDSPCAGDHSQSCGSRASKGATLALTLLRTPVPSPHRRRSDHAVAGLCTAGYETTRVSEPSLREYARYHHLDLHLARAPLEPLYAPPFSKLTVLKRLLRAGYEWIWWVDCDALLIAPRTSMTRLLADHGARDEPTPLLIAGYEPWGWIKEHGEAPTHPVSTGSFFLRGGVAAASSLELVREWAGHCHEVRGHKLWEQQALTHLLRPETVPGGVRTPVRLRNNSILLTANPAYNSLLCPTERTAYRPPVLVHVPRSTLSVGSCEPSSANHPARAAGIVRHGKWKAVLLARILLQGLQPVRAMCCAHYDFAPRLFRKRFNGSIGHVNLSDYDVSIWRGVANEPNYGQASALDGVAVRTIAAQISACGVAGDVAPIVSADACENRSLWVRTKRRPLTAKEARRCKRGPKPRLCAWCLRQGAAFASGGGMCSPFFVKEETSS